MKYLILLISAPFLLAACSDNPVDHDHHHEPVGYVLLDGASEIFRSTNATASDTLAITLEATPIYTVRFVDEDGDLIEPHDDETTLDVTVADEAIVRLENLDADAWRFSLLGMEAGETTVEVALVHGGHADYRSEPVIVRVSQ